MEEKESSESLLANYKNHKEQSIPSDREYIVAPMIESPLARTLWEAPLRDYTQSSQSSDRTFGGKKSDDSVKASPQSKRTWSTAASIFQKSGRFDKHQYHTRTLIIVVMLKLWLVTIHMRHDLLLHSIT